MLPNTLFQALEQLLQEREVLQATALESAAFSLRTARGGYWRRVLPLELLHLHSVDSGVDSELGEELGNSLARALRGKSSPDNGIQELLNQLYATRSSLLGAFIQPESPSTLLSYFDSLHSVLSSGQTTLLDLRTSLLPLLSSFPSPTLPSPPALDEITSSLRLKTATLSTASAKHSLLLATASSSHLLPSGVPAALTKLSHLYMEEIGQVESEVRRLERELEGYDRQMRWLGGGEERREKGERERGVGGYREILGEWEELGKEEKEVRADLRRLGWREGR